MASWHTSAHTDGVASRGELGREPQPAGPGALDDVAQLSTSDPVGSCEAVRHWRAAA